MHPSQRFVFAFFPFLTFSIVAAYLEPWNDYSFDTSLYARDSDDQPYNRDIPGEKLLPRMPVEDEYLFPRALHPQTVKAKLLALRGDIAMMNDGKLPTSVQRHIPGAPVAGDFTPDYAAKHGDKILKIFYDGQDEHNQDIDDLKEIRSRRKEADQYREAADLWAKTFAAHFMKGLKAHKDAGGKFSAGGKTSHGGGRTRQGMYGEEGTSGTAKESDSDISGPPSSGTRSKAKGSGIKRGFLN